MAKQQSMQAKAVAAAPADETAVAKPGFTMPAIFTGPTSPIQARAWAPAVTFAHPKRKDEWNKLQGKFGTVEEGEMYFIFKDRLEHLVNGKTKFGWIIGKQFWTTKDQAGRLLAVSDKEQPHPWKECVIAVVLVYLEDALFPANIEFRTTKCPAAKHLSDAYQQVTHDSKWYEQSSAHKETMAITQPYLRFYGDVVLGDPRPAKSGLPYRPLQANIKPTTLTEWRLIEAFNASEEAQNLFNMCAQRYEAKLEEFAKLIKE
jgi:hypothetical protein